MAGRKINLSSLPYQTDERWIRVQLESLHTLTILLFLIAFIRPLKRHALIHYFPLMTNGRSCSGFTFNTSSSYLGAIMEVVA